MIRHSRSLLIGFAALGVLGASALGLMMALNVPVVLPFDLGNAETVEFTDYHKPKDDDSLLVDDRIEDKTTKFDPSMVDRRPMDGWDLDASDAVIRLDVPIIKPDQDPKLLVLHPSYASAIRANGTSVLPSVNMIDGKAKQFDDGLYAAIDRAYYRGHGEAMKGHLSVLHRIFAKVAKPSAAADYLAAGLSLSSDPVEASTKAKGLASRFLEQEVWSKPTGFYTWDEALSECFRVLRFFAMPIEGQAIPIEIARVLREDQSLRDDYAKACCFYTLLTNPVLGRTPADLIDGPTIGPQDRFTLFPPSTTRETELFEKLFPNGLPANARMIREFVAAIRSGRVDLKPGSNSGWYDHQAYALETLLLPERGEESNKLLLTQSYKKRMLEAFRALITKRRETHLRQVEPSKTSEAPPELTSVKPRLRVEPNPTYYLRTAWSYAFLLDFLESSLGKATLKSLHGLREGGERELDLHAELVWMRDLFYGLASLSAEDIGLRLGLKDGEKVDRVGAEEVARGWLAKIDSDPDLGVDTRASVPVIYQATSGQVRLWVTCGVRLTRLDARYVKPPSLRPHDGPGEWKPVEPYKLSATLSMIPVDEFAEVETRGGRVFTRAELRAICDQARTKEKIIEALQR